MRIKMLSTAAGPTCNLDADKVYEVPNDLGATLIEAKAAVRYSGTEAPQPARAAAKAAVEPEGDEGTTEAPVVEEKPAKGHSGKGGKGG